MWKCKHCNIEYEFNNSEKANHSKYCSKNPNLSKTKDNAKNSGFITAVKRFGLIKDFSVKCEICSCNYISQEREKLFPNKKRYFCSRKCANSIGGKAKADKYHDVTNEDTSYIRIAWLYHKKECVICGEKTVIDVHHLDLNHFNNDPKNLIPLCPTHHMYIHRNHKELIEDKINLYLISKWG